jgi:hypothetical protein
VIRVSNDHKEFKVSNDLKEKPDLNDHKVCNERKETLEQQVLHELG